MRSERSRLTLSRALHAELLAHALASPDREVCGLLGGTGEEARSLYRITNIDPLPSVAFEMAPAEQLAAFRAMDARGEALVGIYHSHPTTAAAPSARDLAEAAYPEAAFLIASLQDVTHPDLRAFSFDGTAFAPLALTISQGHAAEVDTRTADPSTAGEPG